MFISVDTQHALDFGQMGVVGGVGFRVGVLPYVRHPLTRVTSPDGANQ